MINREHTMYRENSFCENGNENDGRSKLIGQETSQYSKFHKLGL